VKVLEIIVLLALLGLMTTVVLPWAASSVADSFVQQIEAK